MIPLMNRKGLIFIVVVFGPEGDGEEACRVTYNLCGSVTEASHDNISNRYELKPLNDEVKVADRTLLMFF